MAITSVPDHETLSSQMQGTSAAESKIIPPEITFGREDWNTFYGDVSNTPERSNEIEKILTSPCPFWSGKQVKDTHLVTYMPEIVGGELLTLNNFEKLIFHPKEGKSQRYVEYEEYVKKEFGESAVHSSYWILVTRDVIPGSVNQGFYEQYDLLEQYSYSMPNTLEGAVSLLLHRMKHPDLKWFGGQPTYIRCQTHENPEEDYWPHLVGCFDEDGLNIEYDNQGSREDVGVIGCMRL